MKVLLFNPPSPPDSSIDRRQRCTMKAPRQWLHPPVGLAYLASSIKALGNEVAVDLLDSAVDGLSVNEAKDIVAQINPDILFVQTGSYTFVWDFEVLGEIKESVPNAKMAVIGELPTAFPKEFLQDYPQLDYCLLREAEITSAKLVKSLMSGGDLSAIPGIAYRKGDNIQVNDPKIIRNLDDLPFPDRSILDNEKYHCVPFFYGMFTDLVTTRGCPWDCKFCTQRAFWGLGFRSRSAASVLAEVEHCVEEYGIRSFFIPDETYTVNRKWVAELNEGFKRLGVRWALQTRVDLVDKEVLEDMAVSGCVYIHYGAESGSQKMLDYYDKGITVDQIRDAFRWSNDLGMETNATFIIGNPEETWETARQTIDLAKEIKADYLHFSPVIPHPLTRFYKEYKEQGLLKHEDFELYVKPNIVFKTKYVSEDDIRKMLSQAYRETLFTPDYVFNSIRRVVKSGNLGYLKLMATGAKWTFDNFIRKQSSLLKDRTIKTKAASS